MTIGALDVVDVATTDARLAREVISTSLPGIELGVGDDGGPFHFTHRRVADDFFAVNRLSLGGRAQSRGEFPDVVAAGRVRSGTYSLAYGRRSIDTTGPFLRPPGRHLGRLEDASLELLIVDRAQFARQAVLHLEGTGAVLRAVTPDTAVPASAEAASLWRSTAEHISAVAADLPLFELPLVRTTLMDLYVMAMLRAFPLASTSGVASSAGATPRALRRAVQYMEDHLGEPITTPMIADAARLSVRGLHSAFATRLATTPMRHLRQLRLQAAREQLLTADVAGSDSVESIARRWGFTHLGRFAASYREAFGTLPSADLRR